MRYWTAEHITGGTSAPRKVARILHHVNDAIREHGGPGARLLRIGKGDREDDHDRFEVDIELVPGVILPTLYGSYEGLQQGWEDKAYDLEEIFADVSAGLIACRDREADLAILLDDLRRRSRSVLADWQREGLPAELVDVRLAPHDHWRGSSIPSTIVRFEGLDEGLRRAVIEARVETPIHLEHELEELRPELMHLQNLRARLADRGASGTIDQLAINAIACFWDVAQSLRRFGSEWRFWLPDDTALVMSEGHVTAGTGVGDGKVDWIQDQVTFHPEAAISRAELDAAIGGPASALLTHPYLTPDIRVGNVVASFDEGRHSVTIALDMPRHLFCNVTGNVWGAEVDDPQHDTVVPFRRTAR